MHTETRSDGSRLLPILLLLFFGSGCAALIYEVVWFQSLQLVIGSSSISLGVLLGSFMGGMCLGSLAFARWIPASWHPLKVYAVLEIGIGLFGAVLLYLIPLLSRLYIAQGGSGAWDLALRSLLCAICLLPPTIMMGATLPAMARWIEATPRGASWLGFFYGGNIAGAVFGCLLAGFYLLRVYDMATATWVAVGLNVLVGVAALLLAAAARYAPPAAGEDRDSAAGWVSQRGAVYAALALSGFCALGAEVVWTRLLSLMLGATTYTFSLILAVFLLGLGLGSAAGSLAGRQISRPGMALGFCQLALVLAITWGAWVIARALPFWPIDPALAPGPWYNFQMDLVRCFVALFPAAFLWGASFPLGLAVLVQGGGDPARVVGRLYAANTLGAILGAVGFSALIIPWAGSQNAQRVLALISGAAGIGLLLLLSRRGQAGLRVETGRAAPARGGLRATGATGLFAAAALAALSIPAIPWELIAYGRYMARHRHAYEVLYVGEGRNSMVAVSFTSEGHRQFHVSGKVEASSDPQDMRLQRMLGHIPALFHPQPKSVLVVGCGAGVTAGSFLLHPDVERVVICEIEPLIPRVVADYFATENYGVVRDPRVEIVFDDARHFVLTTRERFDIITSDPIHPWVKGAATLYTQEYFDLCRQRLKPGGIVTQWVPLYESSPEVVKSELATFFRVFPEGTIWSNDLLGLGYDVVLLGQPEGATLDFETLHQRWQRQDHEEVVISLEEVGFPNLLDLLGTYAGTGTSLAPWLGDAQINRDSNLRLQYLAGLQLNASSSSSIYRQMLEYRTFPERLIVASADSRKALEKAMRFKQE